MLSPIAAIKRCLGSNSGNALILFSICMPAVVGAAGLAVDFSRAQAVKLSAQTAMDAALLAAARTTGIDSDGVNAMVQSYFTNEAAVRYEATVTALEGKLKDEATLEGTASLVVPTTLLKIIGFENLNLQIRSSVMRGLGNVEIALVLDTTGSMSGTKLDNVKTAATTLIDTIYGLPNAADKIKVSLVPFAQYVNVGLQNRNAPWMSVPLDTTTTTTSCYDDYPNATKSNCRIVTYTYYEDGVLRSYESEECDWIWGAPVSNCVPVTNYYTWNGCAGARANPLNIKDEDFATRVPGIQNVGCPSPILPLSKDPAQIKDSITSMYAQGETFIPTGLVWGWRTLSNRAPFTESADDPATANGTVRKYLVLMTDGYNTKSPRYPEADHEGSDAAGSNQLTRDACDNIKADRQSNIDIYTIAFQVADESVKDILRYCATPGGAFFDAVDYDKLIHAFGDIGSSISVARLAK